jgi:hypothetical protein
MNLFSLLLAVARVRVDVSVPVGKAPLWRTNAAVDEE